MTTRPRAHQLTYRDARALYASNIPDRKVIMYKAGGIFSRADKGMEPEYIATRMTTADFFPMFEVPFLYGGALGRQGRCRSRAGGGAQQGNQPEGLRRREQRRQDRRAGTTASSA